MEPYLYVLHTPFFSLFTLETRNLTGSDRKKKKKTGSGSKPQENTELIYNKKALDYSVSQY